MTTLKRLWCGLHQRLEAIVGEQLLQRIWSLSCGCTRPMPASNWSTKGTAQARHRQAMAKREARKLERKLKLDRIKMLTQPTGTTEVSSPDGN